MNNIEFIVLSCDNYKSTRVKSILDTWGKYVNVKILMDSKSEEDNIIGYDTQKNYHGIFDKYLNFFKYYDFNNHEYYFFTDDDTFVNLNNLKKLELPNYNELFCICRKLCLNPDGTDIWGNQTGTNISLITGENILLPLYYQSGGSGFILSKSTCLSVQRYVNETKNIQKCIFGDVSLGFWLRSCNVNIINNKNFWWDTHENLLNNKWEKYDSDKDVITFHYVNQENMYLYHEKYNK